MAVVGTPVIVASAEDLLSERRLNVVVPQFSKSYDETLKQKLRTARLMAGMAATVHFQFYTPNGLPIALSAYGIETGSEYSSSSLSISSEATLSAGAVAAHVREAGVGCNKFFDATVSVYDADNGILRITLPEEIYSLAGIYVLECAILSGEVPVFLQPCLLYVEYSTWTSKLSLGGPPSIDSIRLGLRDSDIYENLLIENHDFDLTEVAQAVIKTVQLWNESPPRLRGYTYSTQTFPFPDIWTDGIEYFLFRMAEEHYRRNKLVYQAGNTTTDDKNRDREYKAAYQERYQLLINKIRTLKLSINVQRGFLSVRQNR